MSKDEENKQGEQTTKSDDGKEAPKHKPTGNKQPVKNKLFQKVVLDFPTSAGGRKVIFAQRETKDLYDSELKSKYFENRKDRFTIIQTKGKAKGGK